MATIDVLSLENKKVGTMELSDDVFAVKVNVPVVHQVIKAQLAGRRQGTAKTKTRTEVRGGGKKPYRQKGTGNARAGSTRSPLFVGGGQNFGPQPRSYEQKTPKKVMQLALKCALSDRMKEKRLLVLDSISLKDVKTKAFNDLLKKNFKLDNVLIVDQENRNLELSGRNIKGVKILRSEGLNTYDVVGHDWLILTKGAVEAVQSRLTKKEAAHA